MRFIETQINLERYAPAIYSRYKGCWTGRGGKREHEIPCSWKGTESLGS